MENRAVIYARYSDSKQQEQSIEGQIQVCEKYAKDNQLVIVKTYIDRAISGRTDKRPAFLEMIHNSNENKFDYVLVYQFDRFARDMYDSLHYKKKLKDNNVKIISALENIEDKPIGIVYESILISMAEYFSLELSYKTKRGILQSLKNNNAIGGSILLGYAIENKKNVIVEDEAIIVRKIFDEYLLGLSAINIANKMNELGYRNKQKKLFKKSHIYYILHNSKYCGIYTHEGIEYPDLYPPIINKEIFNKVQSMLAPKEKVKPRQTNDRYALTGKLICGKCERFMTSDSVKKADKTYKYYSCNKNRHNRKCACPTKAIPKELTEQVIADYVVSILKTGLLDKMALEALNEYNKSIEEDNTINILEGNKKRLNKELNNLIDMIKQGLKSPTIIKEIEKTENELNDIENSLKKYKALRPIKLTIDDVKTFFNHVIPSKENPKYARTIIDIFVHKVIYNEDDTYIVLNINPNAPDEYKIKLKGLINKVGSINVESWAPPLNFMPFIRHFLFFLINF